MNWKALESAATARVISRLWLEGIVECSAPGSVYGFASSHMKLDQNWSNETDEH